VSISKSELICDLRNYIQDELKDSYYYQELARMAPTRRAQEILMEFSRDEKRHAERFMDAYCRLTGKKYQPGPARPSSICDYEQSLKERIMEETNAYEEYGRKYQDLCDPCLRRMFWDARTDEAQHAMRIPILLHEMGADCYPEKERCSITGV
jgi:rubrerythrin